MDKRDHHKNTGNPGNNTAYTVASGSNFGWQSIEGTVNSTKVAFIREHGLGKKYLDVGCGGGAYVKHLRDAGLEAEGTDISRELLDFAQNKYPDCTFSLAEAGRLPFADKSFDTIYAFDVLEHTEDEAVFLKELIRVAAKRILLTLPVENLPQLAEAGLAFAHYQDLTHRRYYTEEKMENLAEGLGLTLIDMFRDLDIPSGLFVARALERKGIINRLMRFLMHGKGRIVSYRKMYSTLFVVLSTRPASDST